MGRRVVVTSSRETGADRRADNLAVGDPGAALQIVLRPLRLQWLLGRRVAAMGLSATFCAFCFLFGLADAGFSTPPHRLADREFLSKQTKVLDLLLHVDQSDLGDNLTVPFSLEENADKFQEPALAQRLAAMHSRGFLVGRGQPFSIHQQGDIELARVTVELLLSAQDFDTFYSAATWAKQRLSEALFSYAFTVAVLRRNDTSDVVLPAPYELWPQFFVGPDVLRRAYDARLRGATADGEKPQTVLASSNKRHSGCPEDLLSYFREDVGLNGHWAMKHFRCPFWLSGAVSASSCDRRGELFYFALRQLAARYDLERLSAGLEPVQPLQYPTVYQKNYTEHPLRRPEAIEILGNIVEGNADSLNENFYGSLYRGLLTSFSQSEDAFPAKQVPTFMENPATALRDPLFYRAVKKLLGVFNRFQDRLGPYKREELEFPGVRVESVLVKPLSTHLEQFEFELDNALPALNSSRPRLLARQRRLTARPFHYQLAVASQHDADVDALLRVYLGPRRRAGQLDHHRHRYVLFDAFRASSDRQDMDEINTQQLIALVEQRPVIWDKTLYAYKDRKLKDAAWREVCAALRQDFEQLGQKQRQEFVSPGVTTLRRTYKDLRFYGRPPLALSALRRRARAALSSGWRLYVDDLARPLGGVERLALPRGRRAPAGLPLSLFVVISSAPNSTSVAATTNSSSNTTITAVSFPPRDGRPVGFPFDRPIAHDGEFDLPNVRFADVTIVHRG
ncbi:hexamerin-like [Schistocerca gregaria]|uniref:hexamerin-like n=1 Tax=Schistocerca gregaria TaxID=7010 RepID=UPI00211E3D02|nr:hexamerin-like [Schistocerca gregaria]